MKPILASLLVVSPALLPTALAGNVTSSWQAAAGGDWRTVASWSNTPALSTYPANGQINGTTSFDVNIHVTGAPYAIALPTSLSLDTVTLNSADATVVQTIGTVRVMNGMNLQAGAWQLNGGTLLNTTVNQNGGGLRFGVSAGKLDNCTVNGDLDFPATNAHALLMNGTTFTGNVDLSGNYTTVGFKGVQTLGGVRTVSLDGNYSTVSAEGEDAVLTLGNFLLVRGRGVITTGKLTTSPGAAVINHGTIRADVEDLALTIDADTFTNYGPVEAVNGGAVVIKSAQWTNAAGGTLRANATGAKLRLEGTWNNAGALEMADSKLELAGNFTTDGLGLSGWSRNGGLVEVNGNWNNTGKTMTLTAATGDFFLRNGTITGGTLVSSGGRLMFTSHGGKLDNVQYQGAPLLDKVSDRVLLMNGADFTGDASLTGNYTAIGVAGGTLAGGKTILLDGTNATVSVEGVDSVLTLGGGLTIRGRGTLTAGDQLTSTGAKIVNSGRVSADISGQALVVDPPVFENKGTAEALNNGTLTLKSPVTVNTGTLRAVNSKLKLEGAWENNGTMDLVNATVEMAGTFDTSDLGLEGWTRTGGAVDIAGTWDNTNATLNLTPATGTFTLRNGTIAGGSITQSGGARLAFSNSGGVLSGVAVSGDLLLDKVSDRVLFRDGSTFSGNAALTGNYSILGFAGVNTLTGPKTIGLDATNASLTLEGANAAMTLDSQVSVRGRGSIRAGAILTSSNTTLRNQGRITADSSGNNLTVETSTFLNEGIAEAVNGGTLVIKSPVWNVAPGGSVQAINANLTFENAWSNQGALTLTNSVLKLDGAFTTAGLGLAGWVRNGGAVNLAGDLNNTGNTLALTPASGDLRLTGGTVTGGTIVAGAQRLLFTNTGGTLNNVLWQGDVKFEESGAHVLMTNGATFTGNGVLSGSSTRLSIAGSVSLAGPRDIQLTGSATALSLEGPDATLTLEPGVTVRGRGMLDSGRVVAAPNARIVNRGVISADIPATKLNVSVAITQEGTLEAKGGTLELPAGFQQATGSLKNAGGIIQINGSGATSPLVINGGRLEGVGQVKPVLSNLPLSVLVSNAVIAPGSTSTGGLILRGDLIPTAGTQFEMELSETAAGAGFSALNEAGTVPLELAGTLSVRMAGGFENTVKNTDVIAIITSNQALAGGFSNAAHGSRITTADGRGSFQVNYGPASAYGADRVVLSHWQATAPVGFAAWAASFGLSGNNATAAADPDSDGITNLVEYVFGLTPAQAGGFGYLPTASINTAGQAVLTFSLPGTLPADTLCEIEVSPDLSVESWQVIAACTGGTWTGTVATIPQGGRTLVMVTDSISGGTAGRRFLRFKVRLE